MILGLLLDAVGIPVLPALIMILSGLVQIAGFAFLIFKHRSENSMDAADPVLMEKLTHIAGYIFIVYALIEIIAACACVAANNACRGGYHYPFGKACIFCNGSGAGTHSGASDLLTLGIYYDAFIVNSFVAAAIDTVKDLMKKFKINL